MAYKIAFQLYSARNFPPLERQLEGLAQIGYDGVEPWLPAYAASAADFRRKIDAAGLACYGFHLLFKDLPGGRAAALHRHCRDHRRPAPDPPYLMPEDRPATAEGWRASSGPAARARHRCRRGPEARLAQPRFRVSRSCRTARARSTFSWRAPGADVGYEIDFAWVLRGGGDPLAELKRYGERMLAIQVKDTAPLGTRQEGRLDGDGRRHRRLGGAMAAVQGNAGRPSRRRARRAGRLAAARAALLRLSRQARGSRLTCPRSARIRRRSRLASGSSSRMPAVPTDLLNPGRPCRASGRPWRRCAWRGQPGASAYRRSR